MRRRPRAGREMRLALIAVLMAALSSPALGQTCMERSELIQRLLMQFGEQPVQAGLSSNGWVLELFMSADGTTWTLVRNLPNGMSCMNDAGAHWQKLPKPRDKPI